MPLPRNLQGRNKNTHLKTNAKKIVNQKIAMLDAVCDKHKINNLTFKSCKLAEADGIITFIEHENIRGNMKSGIMLIKANNMSKSVSDNKYDLVKIKQDKTEQDEKKRQDELEKVKLEMDRIKKNEESINLQEGSVEHKNLLMKLTNESENILSEQIPNMEAIESPNLETIEEGITHDDNEELNKNETNENEMDKTRMEQITLSKDKANKRSQTVKNKRQKALKQYQEQLQKKSEQIAGNKYYRNFMKDIKAKFVLQIQEQYKFLEVRAETTDMVIDNIKIYKIMMPQNTAETFLLVIGDLQLKSAIIKQIDPNYKSDKLMKEQNDFLERIKSKENSQTTVHPEDLLEEEFNDLENLGISSDEDNNEDNNEDNKGDDDNPPALISMEQSDDLIQLMNPELIPYIDNNQEKIDK